jgi:hypothetical protein
MALTEINIFGVLISPYAVILFATWGSTFALRLLLTHFGILAHAWNPALLMFAAFVAIFSSAVLLTVFLP